jgi:hypothetical protein
LAAFPPAPAARSSIRSPRLRLRRAKPRLRRLPPRWVAPLLFAVLLAGFAAGIWGSYRAVFPAKGLYRVTGVFESRASETMILVKHDAVPGLMEEMASMAFFVESRELLDRADLKPGDRVRFTIRQAPERLLVVEIQKVR